MPYRSRRPSRRSGTPRRSFWVSNSVDPTTVLDGASAVVDMLSGIVPQDRHALRRLTVARMLIDFRVKCQTANSDAIFAFGVTEMTDDAITAGVTPSVGVDEIGFYLAVEGDSVQSVVDDNNQIWNRQFDIKTSRTLRGADRSLGLIFTNLSATVHLSMSAHFRLLVQYG